MTVASRGAWVDVCRLDELVAERGVAALVEGVQVAIFLVDGEVHAIDNVDPVSGAAVLSRGVVGSRGEHLTVASPVFKQRFDLRTGECLDDAGVRVGVHAARLLDGRVQVAAA